MSPCIYVQTFTLVINRNGTVGLFCYEYVCVYVLCVTYIIFVFFLLLFPYHVTQEKFTLYHSIQVKEFLGEK